MISIIRRTALIWCCVMLAGNISLSMAGDNPIRIGATVSMEGKYTEPSLMIQNAFRLWVHEINQSGGLLNRKVELILYNDKSQEALAKASYQRLIESDKVDLVFSPYSTPLTLSALKITEPHKYVMLQIRFFHTRRPGC